MKTFDPIKYADSIWGTRDIDGISEFVWDDCILYDISGTARVNGIEELQISLEQWHDVFNTVEVRVRRVVQSNTAGSADKYDLVWDWELRVAPNERIHGADQNTVVGIYGITIGTIREGKIEKEVTVSDQKEFFDLLEGRIE